MNQSNTIIPVVMAGGTGSRLWPLSRELYPKQFLSLVGEHSMLQETLLRLDGLCNSDSVVICNEEHRFLAAEQIREIKKTTSSLILEPVGRNTAPAIALAALELAKSEPEAMMLVLAADHVIEDVAAFHAAVQQATDLAAEGKLVTFGIVPTHAETGYGYIRGEGANSEAKPVEEFVEKPDLANAEAYLASGNYYWNSGMFLFRADRYIEELEKYRPDILQACKAALEGVSQDMDFTRVQVEAFEACPSESIDYAVMEKTEDAWVVPLDAGWNDVGSWSAIWDVQSCDSQGNAVTGDALLHDSKDCLIHADHKLIATVGLKDLVVIETKDAVLVADRNRVQEVKKIVQKLKADERSEHILHREVHRPWGQYDSIDNGDRYQAKRITVKPGAKLSVQMHHHRAEHWVVVKGRAKVRKGDETFFLNENESTFIPVGVIHSLENPGKYPLEIIEVQSGGYLGEDDIVRFEDSYGRS